MENSLTGRTALITGGSRGIGAACASALAKLGAHVVITYRADRGAAQRVFDQIIDSGGSAEARRLDITDAEQVAALTAGLSTEDRPIDILVANAAAPYPKVELLQLNAADLAEKVTTDVQAAHLLTVALAPQMCARGYGRLVYLSGGHVEGPTAPGMVANGTSKAALEGYVKYVVDELTGNGVTANIVRPGFVATDASRGRLPLLVQQLLTSATPADRVARPDDVAHAVVLLALAGEMVNGAVIPVTGGLNAALPLRRISQRSRQETGD